MAKEFGNGYDGNPKRYFGNISRGYNQKPLETSTTQNAPLGAVLEYQDGTQFRYSLAAAAIDTANLCASDVLTASNAGPGVVATDNALTAAAAGATEVILTNAVVGSAAANVFAGAKLLNEDDAGEGHAYPIIASTAADSNAVTLTIHPDFPLAVALTTASDIQIVQHSCFEVITATAVGGSDTNVVGVTPVAVADNEYFWMQTKGLASVKFDSAVSLANSGNVVLSDTAGQAQIQDEVADQSIGYTNSVATSGAHAGVWLNLGW